MSPISLQVATIPAFSSHSLPSSVPESAPTSDSQTSAAPHSTSPTAGHTIPTGVLERGGRIPDSTKSLGRQLAPEQQPANIEQYELADYSQIEARRKHDEKEARRTLKKADKRRWLEDQDEMKFSHSIQFNAVPDWSSHYIAYSNLKKLYVGPQSNTTRRCVCGGGRGTC